MVRLILRNEVQACGRRVWETNLPNVFARDETIDQPLDLILAPDTQSKFNYIDGRDHFLYGHLQDEIQRVVPQTLREECRQGLGQSQAVAWMQHRDAGITTWTIGNGTFATIAGEVVYLYQCQPVLVVGVPGPHCQRGGLRVQPYQKGGTPSPGPDIYVEALTRRITTTTLSEECNPQMGSKYQNLNGDWLEVHPLLLLAHPPGLPEKF
jgi:hypothetical protein